MATTKFTIQHVRLTFIWVQTYFDLLYSAEKNKPLSKFASEKGFKDILRYLHSGQSISGGLRPPWQRDESGKKDESRGNNFWFYYLGGKWPAETSDVDLWRSLMPLRVSVPLKAHADWFDQSGGKLTSWAYHYPFGSALVIQATLINTGISLTELVDLAFQIKSDGNFLSIFPDEQQETDRSLNQIADKTMRYLRFQSLGLGDAIDPEKDLLGFTFNKDPFSLITVIQAGKPGKALDFTPGGALHKTMHALTSWERNTKTLPPPAPCKLQIGKDAPGRVAYAYKQGRMIWFPDDFQLPATPAQHPHRLTCYDNNLTFASMHALSLGQMICQTGQYPPEPTKPNALHRFLARQARDILNRFAATRTPVPIGASAQTTHTSGAGTSYQSDSVRKQAQEFQDCLTNLDTRV